MTKQRTIFILESKLRAYKNGLLKATERNDEAAVKKWKAGYIATRDRIYEIKHS